MDARRGLAPIAIALVVLAAAATALAQTYPPRPDGTERFHTDEAALLSPADGAEIDRIAAELLASEGFPVIVVTIESLASHEAAFLTIEEYARRLFDQWGIGSEQRNYGMLLLVSEGDRRARIELGKQWAGSHDAQAERVMSTLIIPRFKQGDFSGGILAGVRGLDAMGRGLALPKPKPPAWFWPVAIGGTILVIGVIVSLFKSGKKGWGWALIAALAMALFFLLRASASGGGGSFGGGSGGGGGATGSW